MSRDSVRHQSSRHRTLYIFGNIGDINTGNDSTFYAAVYNLTRFQPDARIICICTDPEATRLRYHIDSVPMNGLIIQPLWLRGSALATLLRKALIGIPSEVYRWAAAFRALRGVEALIVAGTGLLTDAYGLRNWGPYTLLKWSLLTKLRGGKLLFVSVGAGPIYSRVGRWLVKSALSLADFRSYRDNASKEYLSAIGVATANDKVYPDLAFSIPDRMRPRGVIPRGPRSVVGLGLMGYAGRYSVAMPDTTVYQNYLDSMVSFVSWLLCRDYDVRLFIGDVTDRPALHSFMCLLIERLARYDASRIIYEPVTSVEELLSQLSRTDLVVATRFHNVLLALVSNKPAVAISFHQKCASLMSTMGLSEYCLDINSLTVGELVEKVCDIEKNAGNLKSLISERAEKCREALEEQYECICREVYKL